MLYNGRHSIKQRTGKKKKKNKKKKKKKKFLNK